MALKLKDAYRAASASAIVKPHPATKRARGQNALTTHVQRGNNPFHPHPTSDGFPPPGRDRRHPTHGPTPVPTHIEDANLAVAASEKRISLTGVGIEEQRVRRRVLFRRLIYEVIARHNAGCKRGDETDGQSAGGEQVEGCGRKGERIGGVDGGGVGRFGEGVCGVGDEGFRVGW